MVFYSAETQLNMYDLFGGFGSVNNVGSGNNSGSCSNVNNGSAMPSQTQEDVLALLHQHHINQALQQQLEQQQRQNNQLKYGTSSLFLNKVS